MKNKDQLIYDLQNKLGQAENDKKELSKAISDLNQCYGSKIMVLEATIEGYENRLQELLSWKKQYIEQQLFDNQKYEEENKKLIGIIDELEATFDNEKKGMIQELEKKDKIIEQLTQEREELVGKTVDNDQKVEELVRDHMREIEQLKTQLIQLKAEITETESEYCGEKIIKAIQEGSLSIHSYPKEGVEEDQSRRSGEDQEQEQSRFDQDSISQVGPLKEISVNPSASEISVEEETRVKQAQFQSTQENQAGEVITQNIH